MTVPEIERMHLRLKTGALIQVSMLLPACRARGLSPEHYHELAAIGSDVGLAFQILDDVLDVEGDPDGARQADWTRPVARQADLTPPSPVSRRRDAVPRSCTSGPHGGWTGSDSATARCRPFWTGCSSAVTEPGLGRAAAGTPSRYRVDFERMTAADRYPLLSRIDAPSDLRRLPAAQLPAVAHELREFLIQTVSQMGGHFAAGLGTVELTVALHYVFDTPDDRLVWDVGHQAYPHKVLTGRREHLQTIKLRGGLAPFPSRAESEYDTFGVGHSSTSISAALGMALAAAQTAARRWSWR